MIRPRLSASAQGQPVPSVDGSISREPDDATQIDLEIAARVREGDEQAFELLFRRYFEALRGFADRYVHDPIEAQEVVQDVFFRLWQNRETFAVRASARTYLYSAVRTGALWRLRHKRVERRWVANVTHEDRPLAEPADYGLRRQETVSAIRQAILALPPRCRVVFEMCRRDGLTTAEVAERLGMPRKTVEQHLWRALVRLQKRLLPLLPVVVASIQAVLTGTR